MIVEDRATNHCAISSRILEGCGARRSGRKVKNAKEPGRGLERIGQGRIAWRRVAWLASTGLILRPNINNKSFRSLSRGVALNGKRTIARGWEGEGCEGRKRRREEERSEHTVARDVRVFYTTSDGGTAFCLCHECSLIFRESITGDRFCPDTRRFWRLGTVCEL